MNDLRGILSAYPDGDTPINELLQNADDAGATIVRFVLDAETVKFGQESLLPWIQDKVDNDAVSDAWQGPALYCYNDGPGFSADDFAAIRCIRAESKAEQSEATGRFGLGFNSVYHFTDAPTVVSNGSAAFFDPMRRFWRKGGQKLSFTPAANMVDEENGIAPAAFRDQFEPLRLFGGEDGAPWELDSPFRGTLIRLPLRNHDGDLGTAYSHQKASELLERLRARGSELLLFLKNIRTIEVLCREQASAPPQLKFRLRRCSCAGEYEPRSIMQRVQSVATRAQLYDSLVASNPLVECYRTNIHLEEPAQLALTSTWLICNALLMTDEMRT